MLRIVREVLPQVGPRAEVAPRAREHDAAHRRVRRRRVQRLRSRPRSTARVSALRASGRLMVTIRVAPTFSTSTTSLMIVSLGYRGPGMLPGRP